MFIRYERVMKDDLFQPDQPLVGRPFLIQKASVRYVFYFAQGQHLRFGIGGLISGFSIASALDTPYGNDPYGYSVFIRAKLAP